MLVQADRADLAELPESGTRPADRASGLAAGIARGAALVAGLTALSRVLGLVRTLVFSQSVGAGCLGTAYMTANQVPNLIYELALGGALTSAMVPVLARSATRAATDTDAKKHIEQICSALLTWGVVILLPLTAIIVVIAEPVASLLIPANPNAACARPEMVSNASLMLMVFAPQILFYGISVVLFGLLQAYRRFTGPTLAPVLANFVMIGSYLGFAALDHGEPLASTPLAAELILAGGTTMNIGMLVIVAVPPFWRLRLRLRPALRFPPGTVKLVGGLALVGLLEFLAADVQSVVTIALANGHGTTGALVLANYASLVFNSVSAVFALSITVSAFPVLSATDDDAFDRTSAGSTRAITFMSWLGSAVIVGVAIPAGHILASQPGQVGELIEAFILSAPGVAGQAVVVNLSRVLFAMRKLRMAAFGLVSVSLVGAVLSVPIVLLTPPSFTVAGLALSSTIAMVVTQVPMVLAIRRMRGKAAVAGLTRTTLTSLAAGAAGAAAGVAVSFSMPVAGKLADAISGLLATVVAVFVFALVAYALNRTEFKESVRRMPGIGRLARATMRAGY